MSIQIKRGSTNSWTTQNPVLLEGQPGLENREGLPPRLKFGDGSTQWTDLPYAAPDTLRYQDSTIRLNPEDYSLDTSTISADSSYNMTLTSIGTINFQMDQAAVSLDSQGNLVNNNASGSLGNDTNPWGFVVSKNFGRFNLPSDVADTTDIIFGSTWAQTGIKNKGLRTIISAASNTLMGTNAQIILQNQGSSAFIFGPDTNDNGYYTSGPWYAVITDSLRPRDSNASSNIQIWGNLIPNIKTGSGGEDKNLGSNTTYWGSIHCQEYYINNTNNTDAGGMHIVYNSSEEAIEFLAN